MKLRKAKLKDVPELVKLWKIYLKDHWSIITKGNPKLKIYEKHKKSAAMVFKKYVTKNIRSRNWIVLVSEIDGKMVGFGTGSIKKDAPCFVIEKLGLIADMFVKKEFRRKGISSALKKEIIKWFKKKGLKHMCLDVMADNKPARKVYEKWGFMDYTLHMRKKI